MSARNKQGLCAYCGKLKKLTKDHVPPKLLLEKPYPPNLYTVLACEDCNRSFKGDDEYTHTVLALDLRALDNPAARSKLPTIIRSLREEGGRGFADWLARQTTPMGILTAQGTPFLKIKRDIVRINNTGLRILRGLYFLEQRKMLPVNAATKLECTSGLTPDHPDMRTIAQVWNEFNDHRSGSLGSAFSYVAAFDDDGLRSAWVMLLYGYHFWVGSVDERDEADRDVMTE